MQSYRRLGCTTDGTIFAVKNLINADGISHAAAITRFADDTNALLSTIYPHNEKLFITPSGYFFLINSTQKDFGVRIASLLQKNGGQQVFSFVDELIDTDIAAMITLGKSKKICGVNRKHNAVFSYEFESEKGGLRVSRKSISKDDLAHQIFACDNPHNKIVGIAGCPGFNKEYLIIAFENGEIIAGCPMNDKFKLEYTLRKSTAGKSPFTFLATENGTIVVYFPEQKRLCKYQLYLYDAYTVKIGNCSELSTETTLSRIALSPDGRYTTGFGENSDVIHCYDWQARDENLLNPANPVCDQFTLKLAQPMSDFIIDNKGNMFAIKEYSHEPQSSLSSICFLGHINEAKKLENTVVSLRSSARASTISPYRFLFRRDNSKLKLSNDTPRLK